MAAGLLIQAAPPAWVARTAAMGRHGGGGAAGESRRTGGDSGRPPPAPGVPWQRRPNVTAGRTPDRKRHHKRSL